MPHLGRRDRQREPLIAKQRGEREKEALGFEKAVKKLVAEHGSPG
jgi:hypothetical protein